MEGHLSDPVHKGCLFKSISWSAVLVGALVGIGLSFLLNLFSLAIGLTAYTTTQDGVTAFAIGGFLGLAIGSIAAMFVAGWISGFLGRPYCFNPHWGSLYGFTTWSLALVLLVLLSTPFARFVSSYSGYISNKAVVVANQTANVAENTSNASNDTERAANTMGKAGLALFVLFFLGAVSSSFGGYFGMNYRDTKYPNT